MKWWRSRRAARLWQGRQDVLTQTCGEQCKEAVSASKRFGERFLNPSLPGDGSTALNPFVQSLFVSGRVRGQVQPFHRLTDEVERAGNDHERFGRGCFERLWQ